MAKVVVTPATFALVEFDNAEIADVVSELCDRLGVPADLPVTIDVDEGQMLGRVTKVEATTDAIDIGVTGGALEDLHRVRHFSPERARSVLGLVLLRALDRLQPGFSDAPADGELTLQQRTAWETYGEGRLTRHGIAGRKQRRHYHFRLRHGFSDEIDAVFERLWTAESLKWSDLDASCAETEAARPGPIPAR